MAAIYKKGERVLVHAVNDQGLNKKRTWYVATIKAVGRGKNEGQYRIQYDDDTSERVTKSDILGKTNVNRKRKAPIVGQQVKNWNVETKKFSRVKEGRKTRGLTARQMLNATPNNFKVNAAYVKVNRREIRKRKDGEFFTMLTRTATAPAAAGDPPSKHVQRIDILVPEEKNPQAKNARLKVSCDCGSFKFMWEYALSRYGAADIVFSNGEPPRVTNPKLSPGICKHLVRLLEG